jgi:hypothetical protein
MSTQIVPGSGFLPRAASLPASQDYAALRRDGLSAIERLAHAVWTDYNVHDPGVTLLELMAFAITDLGMRCAYPVEDLLTQIRDGAAVSAGDFHLAHEVLVCNPVSFDDLRKLLIDLPGVRNAWVERHKSVIYHLDRKHERLSDAAGDPANPPLNGLYDVFLEYEEGVVDGPRVFRGRGRAGLPDNAGAGGYILPDGKGIELVALADCRLLSVAVYAEQAGNVTVRLTDFAGNELARSLETPALAGVASRVAVNFDLNGGKTYRLDAKGTSVKLYRNTDVRYPLELASVVRLAGGVPTAGYYFYFYDWELAYDSSGLTRAEVRDAVIERIHAHRNLCEDVVNICDLDPEEVAVCADIELTPAADTEEVQAQILYRLGWLISPAVRFHSIEELLARGRTIDQIFEGPLLDHGFIDDDEFDAVRRKCEIRTSDVVQELMAIPGVVAVKHIQLLSFVDGKLRTQADWQLRLSEDRFRIAVFSPERSKLIFYKHDLPYYANRKVVEALLKQKKAADIEAKLKGHKRELPVPVGQARAVAEYTPAQNDLPIAYCVGRVRVPESETAARKAHARQLRAYLMFFEQNLANFLAQLASLPALFTWRNGADSTYFTQEVAGLVDFADLDNADYRASRGYATSSAALEAIVETAAVAQERRLRLLEHLAARYCEGFSEYAALMGALLKTGANERLIADKRRFLDDYPAVGGMRGTGFDWRRPEMAGNVSGYQRRVYRLLGIADVTRRDLAGHRFSIVQDGGTPPQWHFELRGEAPDGGSPPLQFASIPCESKSAIEALLDHCLALGSDPANYTTASDGTRQLVQRCAPDKAPEALGEVPSGVSLQEVTAYFARYYGSEGFQLVEQILLRRRTQQDPFLPVQLDTEADCSCPEVADPYSFRISIVLPSWSSRFRDVRFRKLVEDTLRREAPAHVYARICWVSHEQMRELEIALADWQAKLAATAADPGACGEADAATRTGRMPLPAGSAGPDAQYASCVQRLIDVLYGLTTVYPLARLHECTEADGNTPQVTLNNTSLGTL